MEVESKFQFYSKLIMVRTVVDLTVPFIFINEGSYPVLIKEINSITSVVDVKHVRTSTGLSDVMGVDVSAPGASKIELTNDSHGIMNITKIKIIFPYLIRPTKTKTLPDGRLEDLSHDNHKNVQKECIKYLNHLIEIIRYKTGQFWIDYLSGQDV